MKPFNLEVEPAYRYVTIELLGPVCVDTLPEIAKALLGNAHWRPDFDIVVMIGPDTELEAATLAMLKTVREKMRDWNAANRTGAQPRTAIVCPDDFKRVIAALWSALNAGDWPVEIGVFKTLALARDWLQRPAGQSDA